MNILSVCNITQTFDGKIKYASPHNGGTQTHQCEEQEFKRHGHEPEVKGTSVHTESRHGNQGFNGPEYGQQNEDKSDK